MKKMIMLVFLGLALGLTGCGASDKSEDDEIERAKLELNTR